MKAKIEWYQEVLELEPGSKVFFPLARLLSESEQHSEAIRVLRQGLDRHPEYIEARLLLVQLLNSENEYADCALEVNRLSSIFARYPGFWSAWSNHSSKENMATALGLLAASFNDSDLSLEQLIHKGLQSLKAKTAPRQAQAELPLIIFDDDIPLVLKENIKPEAKKIEVLEDSEEPVTLRTKSMAELLLQQGDLAGAVEIYEEILPTLKNITEQEDLRERISGLKANAESTLPKKAEPEIEDPKPSPRKVVTVLESLAQRLDARAKA